MDPKRERHEIPGNPGWIPPPHGGKFRFDDADAQKQAHHLESQRPLVGKKDPGCEPGPPRIDLVPGHLLELGSQDEQPGQRSHKELHLGGQGGAYLSESQVGNAGAPFNPRRAGGH